MATEGMKADSNSGSAESRSLSAQPEHGQKPVDRLKGKSSMPHLMPYRMDQKNGYDADGDGLHAEETSLDRRISGKVLDFLFKKSPKAGNTRRMEQGALESDLIKSRGSADDDDRRSIRSIASNSSLKSLSEGKKGGLFNFRGKWKSKKGSDIPHSVSCVSLVESQRHSDDQTDEYHRNRSLDVAETFDRDNVFAGKGADASPLRGESAPPAPIPPTKRSSSSPNLPLQLPDIPPVSGMWFWNEKGTKDDKEDVLSKLRMSTTPLPSPREAILGHDWLKDGDNQEGGPIPPSRSSSRNWGEKLGPSANSVAVEDRENRKDRGQQGVSSSANTKGAEPSERTGEGPDGERLRRRSTTQSAKSSLSDGTPVVPDVLSPAKKQVIKIAGATIETDDPSHLFWVPAHLHPELHPSDFKKWLNNSHPEDTTVFATRKQPLKRSKSFVERHVVITPENMDDFADKDNVLRSRTISGSQFHRAGKGLPPLKRSRNIRPKRSTLRTFSEQSGTPADEGGLGAEAVESENSKSGDGTASRRRSKKKTERNSLSAKRRRAARRSRIQLGSSEELDEDSSEGTAQRDESRQERRPFSFIASPVDLPKPPVVDEAEKVPVDTPYPSAVSPPTELKDDMLKSPGAVSLPVEPLMEDLGHNEDTAEQKAEKDKGKKKKDGKSWNWLGFLGKKNVAQKLRRAGSAESMGGAEGDDWDPYPNDRHVAQMDGSPRLSLDNEKHVYRISHTKLAQYRRPLYQQVLISNLMLYILSVHADVTLHRQGPRKRGKRGRKQRRGGDRSRSPGRAHPLAHGSAGPGATAEAPTLPRSGGATAQYFASGVPGVSTLSGMQGGVSVQYGGPGINGNGAGPANVNSGEKRQRNLAHLAVIKSPKDGTSSIHSQPARVGDPSNGRRSPESGGDARGYSSDYRTSESEDDEDEDDVPLGMLQQHRTVSSRGSTVA